MVLDVDQHLGAAGAPPAGDGRGQRGEQDVLDTGAVGGRDRGEQAQARNACVPGPSRRTLIASHTSGTTLVSRH
ncbi:hypothetical protein ACWEN3_25185, partial [Streptomyces sp. NPDC004561]